MQVKQKATEHLQKLSQNCDMTAGLQGKLTLAVGALSCYIGTAAGLVNGAIRTVVQACSHC